MEQDQGVSQSVDTPSVEERLTGLADRFRTPPRDTPSEPQAAEVEVEIETPASESTEEIPEPEGQPEEILEVDYEGKQYKIAPELKDALLRQSDYTRKTQEVAERKRLVEEREKTLMHTLQLSEQLAPALGQLANMDAQIKGIHELLTPDLEATDPIRYSTLGTKLNTLLYQRQQFAQGLGGHQQRLMQQLGAQRQQAMQERLADALPKVKAAIKGFTPEVGKQLAEYAKNTGYSQEEIEGISFSAPAVISLWKAKEYDRMQAARPKTNKALANLPPVAKPGARPNQQAEQGTRLKEVTQQWQKGGGKDADTLAKILRLKYGSK